MEIQIPVIESPQLRKDPMIPFYQKLTDAVIQSSSSLCVGLDPVIERLPPCLQSSKNPLLDFLKKIIDATLPYAAAYKPNFAYFEALGSKGIECLEQIREMIPLNRILIGDAKRGDVEHSAKFYAKAIFETFGCDAATVNPYQGWDALQPFWSTKKKEPLSYASLLIPVQKTFSYSTDFI